MQVGRLRIDIAVRTTRERLVKYQTTISGVYLDESLLASHSRLSADEMANQVREDG